MGVPDRADGCPWMGVPDAGRMGVPDAGRAQAIRGLLALERDSGKRAKYMEFIDIYAGLTENEFQSYQQQYPEETSIMAGAFQRARDEARQQGVRQGRVEGERAVLARLLQHRFGPVPAELTERLSQASTADLETWAENELDASTLDDVFDRRS